MIKKCIGKARDESPCPNNSIKKGRYCSMCYTSKTFCIGFFANGKKCPYRAKVGNHCYNHIPEDEKKDIKEDEKKDIKEDEKKDIKEDEKKDIKEDENKKLKNEILLYYEQVMNWTIQDVIDLYFNDDIPSLNKRRAESYLRAVKKTMIIKNRI